MKLTKRQERDKTFFDAGYKAGQVFKARSENEKVWEGKIDLFAMISMICMLAFAFTLLIAIHQYRESTTCHSEQEVMTTQFDLIYANAKENLAKYNHCVEIHRPVITNVTATIGGN